jgi:hypothetical protein
VILSAVHKLCPGQVIRAAVGTDEDLPWTVIASVSSERPGFWHLKVSRRGDTAELDLDRDHLVELLLI